MGRFRDLSIRVTSVDREPVQSASITVERDGRTLATAATDERGRAEIGRDDDRELLIRVEAAGLQGDQRTVSGERPEHLEVFVLGRPELPFFYRDTVRVPFEPVSDAVGVVPAGAGERPADRVAAVADAAGSLGAEVIRSGGNFATGGVAVVGLPAEARRGQAPAPSVEELLDRLAGSPAVERAGALVHLTDEDASFLTDTVIAQFGHEVDDAAAAEIAARHGLRDEGRIEALGNVHTLRFDGPATYAVLDASNALMDEPQVVFAEPDLVHTVAEDSPVIPTDFLFPQQWDHPIIDTPNAWQALSDLDPTLTFGSADVIVAVIDTGVDITHPELAGRVSNGSPKVHKVYDFENGAANMDDLDRDHGTGCASAAVAAANNPSAVAGVNEGIAGVAGNCRLIAVRRGGSELRYAIAYLWAAGLQVPPLIAPDRISPGADVISSSFGVSNNQPISGLMRNTFDALTRDGRQGRGTVLLFSAGNDNVDLDTTFRRPWSMYERCFGVAASTLDNTGVTEIKAGYSDFGSTVDFCAPSDDNQGIHNPPQAFGANAATIQAEPDGDAIPGRPDNQTTLTAAAAVGATVVTVGTTAGMAAGQAVLIGAPGAAATESRQIDAVNAAANQVTVQPGLLSAHGVGTAVASGPRSYQSGFGGTSYSTPVCAGTAALILSAAPHLRWEQVGDILTQTAVKIDPNNTNATGRWRDGAGRNLDRPGLYRTTVQRVLRVRAHQRFGRRPPRAGHPGPGRVLRHRQPEEHRQAGRPLRLAQQLDGNRAGQLRRRRAYGPAVLRPLRRPRRVLDHRRRGEHLSPAPARGLAQQLDGHHPRQLRRQRTHRPALLRPLRRPRRLLHHRRAGRNDPTQPARGLAQQLDRHHPGQLRRQRTHRPALLRPDCRPRRLLHHRRPGQHDPAEPARGLAQQAGPPSSPATSAAADTPTCSSTTRPPARASSTPPTARAT